MAGFAFTVKSLLRSNATFDENWRKSTLETQFASKVVGGNGQPWAKQNQDVKNRVKCLKNEILVWHTKTTIEEQGYKVFGEDLEVK